MTALAALQSGLDFALYYAEILGWHVLALHSPTPSGGCSCPKSGCQSPAKHPRTEHGLYDATTDPSVIRSWWARWPYANVGVRTGIQFDVLDVDGDEGFESLDRFNRDYGLAIPNGQPCVQTGGGGMHIYFQPTGIGNRTRLLPKVDWRGTDGYAVAPPSVHHTGARYLWLTEP